MGGSDIHTGVGLTTRVKVSYGAGGMCDSIKAVASGLFLLFLYTTVLGLPGRFVGLVAGVGLVWDALIDPFIGNRSDRTQGRFGSRHGWMLAGTVGMAVSFFLLFSPPGDLSQAGLIAWLAVTSLVLRTSQSAFTVPYFALGAELDTGYDGRTTVSGYRAAGRQLGALLASGPALVLFFGTTVESSSRQAAGNYSIMALVLASVIAIAGLTATAGTWQYRRPGESRAEVGADRIWRSILRNRAFVVLTAAAGLSFFTTILSAALGVYFLTYYVGLRQSSLVTLFGLAVYVGAIGGVALWTRLARRADKQYLCSAALMAGGGLSLATFWIAPAGGLADAIRMPLLVIGSAAAGAAGTGFWVLSPSMLADVAEEHELHSGERRDGAIFGVFSAGLQVAAGLGVALAGFLVDYFAGVVPGTTTQAPSTVVRIGVLTCIVPGVLSILSALLILSYDLTRRRVSAVQTALAARRATLPAR